MSLGKTDPVALLKIQLDESQKALAGMMQVYLGGCERVAQDALNGLGSLTAKARAGDPNAQQALKQFFAALDAAREASTSKIVLPPGAAAAAMPPPVLIQAGGGELPDDGGPAEAGNVPPDEPQLDVP